MPGRRRASPRPALNSELARAFAARFLAMPVLGCPAALRAGQAAYLPGGEGSVAGRLAPVLSSLSATIHRYDTATLATTAKLAANLLLLSQITALAESFAVGRSGGLSDDQLRELLGGSALVAPGIQNRFEDMLTGQQDGWWTTVLGAKDASLAINVARGADVELPEAEAVKQLYDKAAALRRVASGRPGRPGPPPLARAGRLPGCPVHDPAGW